MKKTKPLRAAPPVLPAHSIWKLLRHPFTVPTWAEHEHQWDTYDVNCAGCLECGTHHWCSENCKAVECEDNSFVCPITGYCLPRTRTSATEYTDNFVETRKQTEDNTDEIANLGDVIESHVRFALCSQETRQTLLEEQVSLVNRKTSVFIRICRREKQRSMCKTPPNMISLAEELAFSTQQFRQPAILSEDQLSGICQQCSTGITRLFVLMKFLKSNTTETRIFTLTIGLLYMMREGITCNDSVLLPQMYILSRVLPLENAMPKLFNMRTKIVTETENITKMAIRKLSKLDLGRFAQNHFVNTDTRRHP